MSEYKNQHYIPQFYLQHFSNDGVGLYRYSLERKTLERRNIDKTCASFYFYSEGDKSSESERVMSGMETIHSKIVHKILKNRNLEDLSFEDLPFLHNFILLTATRTRASKKDMDAMANAVLDIMKPSLVEREEFKAESITLESLNDLKLVRKGANDFAMLMAMVGPALISDLAVTLLINKTKRPLITSDDPVVLFNFIKAGDLGMRGFQSPGLMIYLPLDEEIALCLFDPSVYWLRVNTKGNVVLIKNHDVNELNRLQVLNADEHLIFSSPDNEGYARYLHEPLDKHRLKKNSMDVWSDHVVKDEHHLIYKFSDANTDYSPHFSFIRLNKPKIMAYKKAFRDLRHDRAYSFIRNQEIVDYVDARYHEEMENGRRAFEEESMKRDT